MSEFQLVKVGFISKLNGHNGELVLIAEQDFPDNGFLFFYLEGLPVPFAIEHIIEKHGRLVLKLEDVNDIEYAKRFLSKEVFAELKKKKGRALSSKELTGFKLFDEEFGDLGPILRIDEFPQQEIAICRVNDREVLVPLNEDFIQSIDTRNRQINVSLPSGLIQMYLG